MKPLASPALARPFVETTRPAVARDWPARLDQTASAQAQSETQAQTQTQTQTQTSSKAAAERADQAAAAPAADHSIDRLAAQLRILQSTGSANPALAARLAYEVRAALGAYAAAGAVVPPVFGLGDRVVRIQVAAEAGAPAPRGADIVV